MECLLVDGFTGTEQWVQIQDDTTPQHVKQQAEQAFGHNVRHFNLVCNGEVLPDEPDALRLLESGARLDVVLDASNLLEGLSAYRCIHFSDLPLWAQQLPECAIAAVTRSPSVLAKLPEAMKGNREVVMAAVSQEGEMLPHASEELQHDQDLLLTAALTWHFSGTHPYFPPHIGGNRAFALQVVSRSRFAYQSISSALKQDVGVALAAVRAKTSFSYLPESMACHPDVVHAALRCSPEETWKSAPAYVRGSCVNILVAVLSTAPQAASVFLETASMEWRSNRKFMRCIVRYAGASLQHADPALWEDRELASLSLASWRQDNGVRHIPPHMLVCRKFLMRVLELCPNERFRLPDKFLNDKEVVLAYIKARDLPLLDLSSSAHHDLDIVFAAVGKNGMLIHDAPLELRLNPDILRAALRSCDLRGWVWAADPSFLRNWDVVQQILASGNPSLGAALPSLYFRLKQSVRSAFSLLALRVGAASATLDSHLPHKVLRHAKVRRALLERPPCDEVWRSAAPAPLYPWLPRYCAAGEILAAVGRSPAVFIRIYSSAPPCDDVDIAISAASGGCLLVLPLCSARLRDHLPLVRACVDLDGSALRWASPRLAGDGDTVKRACAHCPYVCRFASPALRSDAGFSAELVAAGGAGVLLHLPEQWDAKRVVGAAVAASEVPLRCTRWRGWCDDEEVMACAVRLSPHSLRHASVRLCNRSDIVLMAVGQCGAVLSYAGCAPRSDLAVALGAVENDFTSISSVDPSVHSDPELLTCWLRAARAQHAASSACGLLQEEVMLQSLARQPRLALPSQWLAGLKGCATGKPTGMAYTRENWGLLADVHPAVQREAVLRAAASADAVSALRHAGNELLQDRVFVGEVVDACRSASGILHFLRHFSNDRALFLASFAKGAALYSASKELRSDPEVLVAVAQHDPSSLCYALGPLGHTWARAAKPLCRARSLLQRCCTDDPLNDRDTFLAAVRSEGQLLDDVPVHLVDREMVQAALSQDTRVMLPLADYYSSMCHGEGAVGRDVAVELVRADPLDWRHLPKAMKDSHDVASRLLSAAAFK